MACCSGVCSGVGGAGGVVRVRLCFDYPPPCLVQCRMSWVLLDLRECRVITDVVSVIREKFQYSRRTELDLYLQDCYLPPAESAHLLRDSDTLRVKVCSPVSDHVMRKRRREEEDEPLQEHGASGEPKSKKKHKKKKQQLVVTEEPSCSKPRSEQKKLPDPPVTVNGKSKRSRTATSPHEPPAEVKPSSEEEPAPVPKSSKIQPQSSTSAKTEQERPAGSSSHNKGPSTAKKSTISSKPLTVPPKSASTSKPGRKTQNSSSSSSSSDENEAPVVKRKSTITVKPSAPQNQSRSNQQTSTDSSSSSSEEEDSSKSSTKNAPKSTGEPTKATTKNSTGSQALKKPQPPPSSDSSSDDEVPPKPAAEPRSSCPGPLENGSTPVPLTPVSKNLPNHQQNGGSDSGSSDTELVIKRPHPQVTPAQTPRGRGRGLPDRARSRGGGRGGFGRARGTPWKQGFHHTYQHEEKHQRETLSNRSVLLQNPPDPVVRRDYDALPLLAAPPAVGTKIAFKLLELTENYTPQVSDYKEGKVVGLNPSTSMIELELLTKSHTPAEPGKFDLVYQNPDGSEHVEYAVTLGSQLTERWESLLEPRLILEQTT
ncbi:coilin [Trichomycterus rosablanca]|uniref:coilin n=1 Tax=Trichomycterus rosablanca TaxID=2290929 RepID=UPI002F353B23